MAWAKINCVPLIKPKPSFACNSKGAKLCFFKTSFAGTILEPIQKSPSPINGKNK